MELLEAPTKIARYTDDDLRRMVGPDPNRPSPDRHRVRYDDVNIPVWPLIGQLLHAWGWDPDSRRPQVELVAGVAREYDVPVIAVEAAILYYQEHRGEINVMLDNGLDLAPPQ